MRPPRPEKKSETLEIRLGHAAKSAFMARCRTEGRTASEAVRAYIDAGGPERRRRSQVSVVQALAAALAGLAIGAAAAPSVAQSVSPQAAFERLDRDSDGVLTPTEFARR